MQDAVEQLHSALAVVAVAGQSALEGAHVRAPVADGAVDGGLEILCPARPGKVEDRPDRRSGGHTADPHPVGASDYSALFPRVQAAKPDVLVIANFGKDQLNSVKQAASFGIKNQMKIFLPIFLGTMRREGGPDVFDGVHGGTSFYWELAERMPTAQKFVDAFQKKYQRPPYDYGDLAELLGE
jgi:hypothetical protein